MSDGLMSRGFGG